MHVGDVDQVTSDPVSTIFCAVSVSDVEPFIVGYNVSVFGAGGNVGLMISFGFGLTVDGLGLTVDGLGFTVAVAAGLGTVTSYGTVSVPPATVSEYPDAIVPTTMNMDSRNNGM